MDNHHVVGCCFHKFAQPQPLCDITMILPTMTTMLKLLVQAALVDALPWDTLPRLCLGFEPAHANGINHVYNKVNKYVAMGKKQLQSAVAEWEHDFHEASTLWSTVRKLTISDDFAPVFPWNFCGAQVEESSRWGTKTMSFPWGRKSWPEIHHHAAKCCKANLSQMQSHVYPKTYITNLSEVCSFGFPEQTPYGLHGARAIGLRCPYACLHRPEFCPCWHPYNVSA